MLCYRLDLGQGKASVVGTPVVVEHGASGKGRGRLLEVSAMVLRMQTASAWAADHGERTVRWLDSMYVAMALLGCCWVLHRGLGEPRWLLEKNGCSRARPGCALQIRAAVLSCAPERMHERGKGQRGCGNRVEVGD